MPRIVSRKPSDFVRLMTSPGLPIPGAGMIPVRQYLCSLEDNGGNKNADTMLRAINRHIPLDPRRGRTPDGRLTDDNRISLLTRNFGRLTTGQGYADDFVLMMSHIARNIDAVKRLVVQPWVSVPNGPGHRHSVMDGPPRPIAELCGGSGASAAVVLHHMVRHKVFGMDCIGFVSQYLVHAGLWPGYKPYNPQDYVREFVPIEAVGQIRPLAVLMWNTVHVAIIDAVKGWRGPADNPTAVVVDICQSSSGGPQINSDVVIERDGTHRFQGHQLFRFRNRDRLPVSSPVYIGVMPGLVYQAEPRFIGGELGLL